MEPINDNPEKGATQIDSRQTYEDTTCPSYSAVSEPELSKNRLIEGGIERRRKISLPCFSITDQLMNPTTFPVASLMALRTSYSGLLLLYLPLFLYLLGQMR